jgi:uncharacterized iron-regulated protein
MNMRRGWMAVGLALAAMAAAGASPLDSLPAGWPSAELLLLGEQHDAAEHQQLSAAVVRRLAAQGRLAAVAMEMAEQGRSTAGLTREASEVRVREALAWDERGWPWPAYGPIVMAAVRAGVPVVGANLPRKAMKNSMGDATLDSRVSEEVRRTLLADVRDSHCGLLPESQLRPMTRIQISRDLAMADTLRALAVPDRVVLLVAGAYHVDAGRGVPQHLAGGTLRLRTVHLAAGAERGDRLPGFDETWPTPATAPKDHCAELAKQMAPAR